MPSRRWTIRADSQVTEFISEQETVVRYQIEKDLEKLRSRGLEARSPLVKHLKGDIYYLRTKCEPHGIFRTFYFRDGKRRFRAFFAYQKKDQKLPDRIRRKVLRRYRRITGKKP